MDGDFRLDVGAPHDVRSYAPQRLARVHAPELADCGTALNRFEAYVDGGFAESPDLWTDEICLQGTGPAPVPNPSVPVSALDTTARAIAGVLALLMLLVQHRRRRAA